MTGDVPAPTVPDEAVEAAARELWPLGYEAADDRGRASRCDSMRQILDVVAPFIVAANQPDAAEVEQMHGSSVQPDLDAIRGRYRAADFATDEPWAAALNDVVLSSWLDVPALLAEVERLRAQRGAVLALHVSDGHPNPALAVCKTCYSRHPCATAQALGITDTP